MINAGKSLWNQRLILQKVQNRFKKFATNIGFSLDLDLPQYMQLFSMTMEFEPDIIIETGRHYGNSTCVLTEAANLLKDTNVVSLCLSDLWQKETVPKLTPLVSPEWFQKLDARISDICDVNIDDLIKEKKRILFLWDAHGWDVAEYVLGYILPAIQKKSHIVLVHDISNIEYNPDMRNYNGQGLWKEKYIERPDGKSPYIIIGSMCSPFEEIIPLADFANRNQLDIHSVEGEIRQEIDSIPERKSEMQKLLTDMYSPSSAFYWFTLNSLSKDKLVSFPKFPKPDLVTLMKEGTVLLKEQKPWEALVCFNRAIKLAKNEDSAFVQYARAAAFFQMGQLDEAKRCLRLNLFANPNCVGVTKLLRVIEERKATTNSNKKE